MAKAGIIKAINGAHRTKSFSDRQVKINKIVDSIMYELGTNVELTSMVVTFMVCKGIGACRRGIYTPETWSKIINYCL